MKFHLPALAAALLIFSFQASRAQTTGAGGTQKRQLKDYGVTLGAGEVLEGYYNVHGGIKSGAAYASTFDAHLTVDLQKLVGLPHGTFYTDLEYHFGDNPSTLLTGDVQVFDKHSAPPFLQILEIWYQQELFAGKLRIKAGKVDANTEFSVIDNGLEFINSPTQVTPTFFVFPTFPDPMPAVNLFFTPGKLFYTSFAVYDANRGDRFLDFYGDPALIQPSDRGQLLISESGLRWDQGPLTRKDGNLKIGLWKHTGVFTKWRGGVRKGADGFYLILDQTLWRPADSSAGRGVRLFAELAAAEASVSPVWLHYGGGIAWTGPWAARPADIGGLSVQNARLSSMIRLPYSYELNFEAFYKLQLKPWLDVKPDLQYIVHPSGIFENALVATLLLSFDVGS
jgi:porin